MKTLPTIDLRAVAVAAALAGLAACAPPASTAVTAAPDTSADIAAIKLADAQMNQYLKVKGLEGAVSYYAHDGLLMAPGAAAVSGSDAIRDAFTSLLTDPNFTLSFTADKVVVANADDLAYATGAYAETATNPKTHGVDHQTGRYVTVYHKTADGQWKAVADINTPEPVSP